MKVIIIDDERSARNILERLLGRVSLEIEVLSKCEDLPSGVKAIKKLNPDVVFLDVQMPEYAGYEITSFFETIDFEIVFVTAHNEFAIKAFELSAIDYLLKPIQIDRITETINRLSQRLNEKKSVQEINELQNTIVTEQISSITVIEKGIRHVIQLEDIAAFQAEESYTMVYLGDGTSFLSSKHLKYYERSLEEDNRFFRTHKSWVVNLRKVKQYNKSEMNVYLTSNCIAKLSRYRVQEFEEHFK